MDPSASRSAPPAPLAFHTPQYGAPDSPSAESISSTHYSKDKVSSYPFECSARSYSGTYSDASTMVGDHPLDMRHSSVGRSGRKPTSPTGQRNANSYCGRHSSEWLFSGWSIFGRKGST